MFLRELLNGRAHVVDNAVATERELGADVNSFQRLAVFVHGSNAKVGTA